MDGTIVAVAGGVAVFSAAGLYMLNRSGKLPKGASTPIDVVQISYDKQTNKMRLTMVNTAPKAKNIKYTAIRQKILLPQNVVPGMAPGQAGGRDQYALLGEHEEKLTLQPNDLRTIEYALLPNDGVDMTALDVEIDGVRVKYSLPDTQEPAQNPQQYYPPHQPYAASASKPPYPAPGQFEKYASGESEPDPADDPRYTEATDSWNLDHLTGSKLDALSALASKSKSIPTPTHPEPKHEPETMDAKMGIQSEAPKEVSGSSLSKFMAQAPVLEQPAMVVEKPIPAPSIEIPHEEFKHPKSVLDSLEQPPQKGSYVPGVLHEINLNKNVMMLVKGKDMQINRVIGEITHEVYLGKILKLNIHFTRVYGGRLLEVSGSYFHEGWTEREGDMQLLPEEIGPTISYKEEN